MALGRVVQGRMTGVGMEALWERAVVRGEADMKTHFTSESPALRVASTEVVYEFPLVAGVSPWS